MKPMTWSSTTGALIATLVLVASGVRAADYTEDMVKTVDMANESITLQNGSPMQVSDGCKVVMNGKSASLSNVKAGEKVRVATSGEGQSRKIVEIWILQPAGTSTGSGSSHK
jgi:hypothetical protein